MLPPGYRSVRRHRNHRRIPARSNAAGQGRAQRSVVYTVPGITIAVVPLPAGASAQQLPFFNGQVPGARPISGLGDAAVAFSPGQVGPHSVEIYVATHGSVITLALVTGSPHTANPVQSMTTLAQAVVGRYP